MRKYLLATGILLTGLFFRLPASFASGEQVERVALPEFRVLKDAVSASDARYLTEVVRSVAGREIGGGRYALVTKDIVDLLSPEGLAEYKRCAGELCGLALGRQVSADYILEGEIRSFGKELRLVMKLWDVGSGKILSQPAPLAGKDAYSLEKPLKKTAVALFAPLTDERAVIRKDPAEVILLYEKASPEEKVRATIDGRVVSMHFSDGTETLRLEPGSHSVRLLSAGRVWMKEFDVESGGRLEESVIFPSRKVEAAADEEPGNLYIETLPPGATVYLNGVEQAEKTPLTLEDVIPGECELVLAKPPLWFEKTVIVQVNPLDFTHVSERLDPNFTDVEIDSEPGGAILYLDGEQKGATKYENPRLESGRYALKLVKPLHYDMSTILNLPPGEKIRRKFILEPKFGKLTVTSEPSRVRVKLDGKILGFTPVARDSILSGEYTLLLEPHHHYSRFDERILIEDGGHTRRSVTLLDQFGRLSVETDPDGAYVKIAGQETATAFTPIKDLKLSPGSYRIDIGLKGYEPAGRELIIAVGSNEKIDLPLVRMKGNLKISTEPQGAQIILRGPGGGKLAGKRSPAVMKDLPSGRYSLTLDKSGYDLVKDEITVRNNETSSYSCKLQSAGTGVWMARRARARKLSLILPGGGQFLSRQYIRGSLYSGVFIGTLIYAGMNINDHARSRARFDDAKAAYDGSVTQSDLDEYYSRMTDERTSMARCQEHLDYSLYAAAGIYTIQLLDAIFLGGGPRPVAEKSTGGTILGRVKPSISPSGEGLRFEVVFNFGTSQSNNLEVCEQ